MPPERPQASLARTQQRLPSMKLRASSVLRVRPEYTRDAIPEKKELRLAGIPRRRGVVAAAGEVASVKDVVRCPYAVPPPGVGLERDSVLAVAVDPAVTAVEDLYEQLVAFGAHAQPQLLLMVREVVERHDVGLAPAITHGEHLGDIRPKHREVAPTDFGALFAGPDHALGPVQERLWIAPLVRHIHLFIP